MPDNDKSIPKPDFSNAQGTPNADAKPASSSPKPDFSNVRSGGSSTAPVVKTENIQKLYTVVAGDSLSKIAKKELGDSKRWTEIFEANKDIIKNPDLIHPGQVLKMPTGSTEGKA